MVQYAFSDVLTIPDWSIGRWKDNGTVNGATYVPLLQRASRPVVSSTYCSFTWLQFIRGSRLTCDDQGIRTPKRIEEESNFGAKTASNDTLHAPSFKLTVSSGGGFDNPIFL